MRNPIIEITHANLKETNVILSRIAHTLELILFHAFDVRSEYLKQQATEFSTEGTTVEYADSDQQAVAEELEKMGYNIPEEDSEEESQPSLPFSEKSSG
jgi:vacuolar-type H+-ATPase subunit I/STV1